MTNRALFPFKTEKQSLNLKGSAKTVAEFFVYAVNSVLWQRGVYPGNDCSMNWMAF